MFVLNWMSLYGGTIGTAQGMTAICGSLSLLFPFLLWPHFEAFVPSHSLFLPFRTHPIFCSFLYFCRTRSLRCAFIARALCYLHQLWVLMPTSLKCSVMRCACLSLVHLPITLSITRCACHSLVLFLLMLSHSPIINEPRDPCNRPLAKRDRLFVRSRSQATFTTCSISHT